MSILAEQLSERDVSFDDAPVPKRMGLLIVATDHTTEREFARICDPDEMGVYVSRIAYENPTTPENLHKMGSRLPEAAGMILPDEDLDVVAYSCTAASVVLGDEFVESQIRKGKPEVACVTPTSAAFAAFKALNIKRVSVLTPYSQAVTDELVAYFETHGIEVVNAACAGLEDDRDMARIMPSSLVELGKQTMRDEADALFISCTAVRAVVCVDELERQLGKPVITSNQALVWRSLRLAGITRPVSGYGRLLTV